MDLNNRAERIVDSRVATMIEKEPVEKRYNELRKYAL